MRVDPDDSLNSWFLSRLLNQVGRNREAAELAAASLAHDQYMPVKIGHMLRMLEVTGEIEEAEKIYQRARRWWPDDDDIFWWRTSGMLMRGDFEAARRFQRETADQGHRAYRPIAALLSPARSDFASRARSACAQVKPQPNFDQGQTLQCMFGLARVGDLDGAYRFADGIYPSRRGRTPAGEEKIWLDNPDVVSVVFLTAPVAAPLRRDQRYLALAERVGLLEYWRSGRPPDFCRKNPEPICRQLLNGS
jgi:hypothetical protein